MLKETVGVVEARLGLHAGLELPGGSGAGLWSSEAPGSSLLAGTGPRTAPEAAPSIRAGGPGAVLFLPKLASVTASARLHHIYFQRGPLFRIPAPYPTVLGTPNFSQNCEQKLGRPSSAPLTFHSPRYPSAVGDAVLLVSPTAHSSSSYSHDLCSAIVQLTRLPPNLA